MTIRQVEATCTRAADTTQYTAGDVVGAVMTFGAELGGLVRGALVIDSAAEATKPDLDLMLFTELPTVAADNAAFAPTDAEMKTCIGTISFDKANFKTGNANGHMNATAFSPLPFFAHNRKLWGVLIARNAYSPIDSEVFNVRLGLEQ